MGRRPAIHAFDYTSKRCGCRPSAWRVVPSVRQPLCRSV